MPEVEGGKPIVLDLAEFQVNTEKVNEIAAKGAELVEQAKELVIDSKESYQLGGEILVNAKRVITNIEGMYKPIKNRFHRGHKDTIAEEKAKLAVPAEVKDIIGKKMEAWDALERARIRKEQEEREEAARKAAEEERLREAEELEKEGKVDEAEAVLEEDIPAPMPVPVEAPPKVAGVSYGDKWSANVVSTPELITWAAQDVQNRWQYLVPNHTALNALARSQKSAMRVGGVTAKCERVTSVRG